MLWRIKNFKGVGTAEIDIRPGKATVLTGVNSSGKSSIIQSLLLVAQSIQNENRVVLNGPLVRLGDAQDLVRDGSGSGAIELGIGLEEDTVEESFKREGLQAVFDLVPADDRSMLSARRLRIGNPRDEKHSFEMGRENARASDVHLAMQATSDMGTRDVLHLKSLLDSGRRQLRTYVVVQGLRPVAVVELVKPEVIAKRFRGLLDALLHDLEPGSTKATTVRLGSSALIRDFIRLLARSETDGQVVRSKFSDARMGNPHAFSIAWRKFEPDERRALVERAVAERVKDPYVVLPIGRANRMYGTPTGLLETQLVESLGPTYEALNLLASTLGAIAGRVHYLGPLRDEPRVVWNHWNELARGLPVGTRGEYSAAVLSRWGEEQITYVAPETERSQKVTAPLSEAVNQWLTYLEIGDAIKARSHGKLGVGLDLRVNGQVRDLTSVGVGVSQALPLLVGLLTSPYDSIFIVEQPELHLHPAVQARLADFMLNARPDLTVIIETHSEAFVTRVRRRAAEGKIQVSDVDITFIELGKKGSTARVLEISHFGDLSEWPDGFLSAAEDDIRAIIQANIRRSAATANAN